MKKIYIADTTLCQNASTLSFKEKIEIARLLERLKVDCVELPTAGDTKADMLLLRTLASFVKQAALSVCVGLTAENIPAIMQALSNAEKPVLRIELPTSPVGMEYTCHRKPPKMLALITELVTAAKQTGATTEFCALDATRAEEDFLKEAIKTAVAAGADRITLSDDATVLLPDEFAAFVAKIKADTCPDTDFAVQCNNKNGMANAAAILAVNAGASTVKTAVSTASVDLETFAGFIKDHHVDYTCGLQMTELNRTVSRIARNCSTATGETAVITEEGGVKLDSADNKDAVAAAVAALGYELSDDDLNKVFEEFKRIAEKKSVGTRELDAIVATVASQVPPTYKLVNFIINSCSMIPCSAHIRLETDGKEIDGIQLGDGPIDAAFRAIEQLTGRHYELEDFQIQTVTEGHEAMGMAIVKLRMNGRVFSGNGISTDIIGASIRAYLGAVNKIVYEEA